MKKICIIGDFCYPSFAGGSSKHVYDIMAGFDRRGIETRLQTRRKSDSNLYSADDADAETIYRRWVAEGRVKEFATGRIFNPFSYLKGIRSVDFVLIEHPVMGLFGAMAARMAGKKTIYHYHGPIHLEYAAKTGRKGGLKYRLLWLMQKMTAALSHKILFHSEYMKGVAVREHGVAPAKCVLLPPYIDPRDPADEPRLPCEIDPEKVNILIPRRLTARTGVVEFLTLFNELSDELAGRFTVYVTGVGELEPQVRELAARNPGNVRYLGFVTYEQLWALYRRMTAVAVPTLDLEGFGYVILEALSCGAGAIVSTTCGGGYDFVRQNLGDDFCFDVSDKRSVRAALEFIARRPKSPSDYRAVADRFSTDAMLDTYIRDILR